MGYRIKTDDYGRAFICLDRYDGEPDEWVQMNNAQMEELSEARKVYWELDSKARTAHSLARRASDKVESIVVRIVKGTP